MTPSLKKVCILCLLDSLTETIKNSAKKESIKWKATKLQEAGIKALRSLDFTIDKSKRKYIIKKINEVYVEGDVIDILFGLIFLNAGLCDLEHYNKHNKYFNIIMKRTIWLLQEWDKQLDKNEMYADAIKAYEEWIK
jgi:hypothetical protein